MKLAIFSSHEGTTLQAVLDAVRVGDLPASVRVVISNNSESGALRRAREAGIPAMHISTATHSDSAILEISILRTLRDAEVDVILLAGYLKKLGPVVLQEFRGRILNTHPSLLPKFGGAGMFGRRVYEAVLAAGESETGASIHLVEEEYDTGRVIAQCRVPVQAGDSVESLAARVQEQERSLVVYTLARISKFGFEPAPNKALQSDT